MTLSLFKCLSVISVLTKRISISPEERQALSRCLEQLGKTEESGQLFEAPVATTTGSQLPLKETPCLDAILNLVNLMLSNLDVGQ